MPAPIKAHLVRVFVALATAIFATGVQAVPPDMTKDRIVFFAPLPPLPPGSDLPFRDGAPDFDDLFKPGAAWDDAAAHIDVFAVPSTWVRHYATDQQLTAVIEGLRARGIALGMEVGPLPDFDTCAKGEGFSGVYEIDLMRKIRDFGGTVDVVVFDEPFGFGHVIDAPGACQWSVETVAGHLANFVKMTRKVFPDAVFGGNEPLWAAPQVKPEALAEWVDAYAAAAGEPLGFLHLDMEWSWPGWLDHAVAARAALAGHGVRVGYIYNGGEARDQAGWIAATAERAFLLESRSATPPDDAIFQSWFDQPDRTLPDSDPTSFTGVVKRYFQPHSQIELTKDAAGVVRTADGKPIAGAPVRASLTSDAGITETYKVTGTVPADAKRAVAIFRVNGESAAASADVDMRIESVSYSEGGKNLAPNPDFKRGGHWGGYGAGSARIDRSGSGTLRLKARKSQILLVDTDPFAVKPGAAFSYEVVATVPASQSEAVYAGVVFLAKSEVGREGLSLDARSTVDLPTAVTAADGTFRIDRSGARGSGHLKVAVDVPDYWPSFAEADVR